MNPRKSAADLSPSTFNQYRLPYTKLFLESVQATMNPKVSDRATVTWLRLQPILRTASGYLLENGEPYDDHVLASKIWRELPQLTKDLETLVKFDLLRSRDDGVIFDPLMVLDIEGKKGRNGRNTPPGQFETYANAEGSPSEGAISKFPHKSRVEVFSGGAQHPPSKNYCNSGSAASETDNQKSLGAGAPVFCGLTGTDLEAVSAKYPDRDAEVTFQKFVRYHTNKGTAADKITRGLLDGWFKREKEKTTSTVTTTASDDSSSTFANSETAFMRDMPREDYFDEAGNLSGHYSDDALNWFCAHQNLDDPNAYEIFDAAADRAVANGDVVVVDSVQGKCRVGAKRQPVMVQKEAPVYNKGGPKDDAKKRVVCMMNAIFIDERKLTIIELGKIRAMEAKTENQAVEFLKELLPDVETNWVAVLDEDWLFEKDADGLYVGKVTA
jgi:hypothetical protein